MFKPIKIMDLELSAPPQAIHGLESYQFLQLLVRLHGTPLGYVKIPVIDGCCSAASIGKAVLHQQSWPIIRRLLLMRFSTGVTDFTDLIKTLPSDSSSIWQPLVTVAVCTRDCPTEDLRLCLDSLNRLDYPNLDIIIIDNAPCSPGTKNLVTESYPQMKYICEPRPGLNWARNRAIIEARGDLIAFTDDDVVVDPGWVKAMVAVFDEEPEAMAVTGAIVPYELGTEAQALFEKYGGFCKGFTRRWYCANGGPVGRIYGGSGRFGAGANMAFRHSLFEKIGYFDPALDVGTVTTGGGDLEIFFRVIKEGYMLVYEPKVLVRHRHRRDYPSLRKQIASWGIGFSAHLWRSFMEYPDERSGLFRLYWWWVYIKIRCVLVSLMYPNRLSDLLFQDLRGLLKGISRYHRAQWTAAKVRRTYGDLLFPVTAERNISPRSVSGHKSGTAVRFLDIACRPQILDDVTDYPTVRIFVHQGDMPIGTIDLPTLGQPIRETRLSETLVDYLGSKLFNPEANLQYDTLLTEAYAALERHLVHDGGGDSKKIENPLRLSDDQSVSIILATYDRPDDLRECLNSVMAQKSTRKKEVIVVDNNPLSGLTPPVVAAFPNAILLNEKRKGSSYARNAGIAASTGDIIVTIDDDEAAPPGWLEKLLTPFLRSDVMLVTGNVLPMELETPAQHLFEIYGAFGRGYEPIDADRRWFESTVRRAVPTWRLGGTGNAAYRSGIFADPLIGLFDEALGAPNGVGEDTYLFYKVLKAGYTVFYEPKAYLFHKHRRSFKALQSQIYNYSKGHVAYHLTTFFNDHDFRALVRLFIELPRYHIKRLIRRFLGRKDYPLSLILCEIAGTLAGPYALFKSRRRVRRLGASKPYTPFPKQPTVVHAATSAFLSKPYISGHTIEVGPSILVP
jgi:glycosyltransferase involved in cell wall biosynthesis